MTLDKAVDAIIHENGALKRAIKLRDKQINELREQVQDLQCQVLSGKPQPTDSDFVMR